jgi:octaprenyl-diphosphate synthase
MPGLLNFATIDVPLAALLDEQLDEVGLILERQLASDHSAVNALCRHIEEYRGKQLRPLLVLLCGLATARSPRESALTEKHRVVAAVVELIHLATLVHDDVLDEARIRRQVPTLNNLRGNETAVMLGDYLISNAFHLCSTLVDPAINLALGEVTNTLCEGELLQLHHRDDHDVDEQTYFEIVRSKTASLIGECCRLGARVSGAPEPVGDSLHRFGIGLGIAFQIQDDLLDMTGDEAVVGKSLGRDLDCGKVTLPLIRYLGAADQAERRIALREFSRRSAARLRDILVQSGAVEQAHRHATGLVEEAKAQLRELHRGPARDLLEALADAVISREF